MIATPIVMIVAPIAKYQILIHADHCPSDLLVVWSGTFSTVSADANRRDC